jgi:4-amino-4-deoxy-L-arabinose transferase-like glycosyltransferase
MWYFSKINEGATFYMSRLLFLKDPKNGPWLVLLFAFLVRLGSLGAYPLFDNTESRYAEIAREMVATNNWITPQFDYGVAYWGKPPLSTWASAIMLKVFGNNEFGVRFSSLLFGVGIVWLVYLLAAKRQNGAYAVKAAIILATTASLFVASGCVMTDAALTFATTLCMVAFWMAINVELPVNRFWGYLFFAGLGIGLLAKGPVAVVLTIVPVLLWTAGKKEWTRVWQRLPWLTGSLLALTIALPWYFAAERATPGFLNYFFIGEHWRRFTESGWKGDLYGTGHAHTHGTIWLYWLFATFPWCLPFIGALLSRGRRAGELLQNDWQIYLILWASFPMIFFTLSGNILWTYVLPGVPAFALLSAELMSDGMDVSRNPLNQRLRLSLPIVTPAIFILALIFLPKEMVMKQTQKEVVASYVKANPGGAGKLIYFGHRPYSAEFYSNGTALVAGNQRKLQGYLAEKQNNFYVIEKKDLAGITESGNSKFSLIGNWGKYQLLTATK